MADDKDAAVMLAETLWRDPTARLALMRETKRIKPDVAIPELEAHDLVTSLRTEAAATKASREALDAERQRMTLERARTEAITKHGLSPADVPEIEKLMTDRLIADHDTAAEHLAQRRALADIAAPRSGPSTSMLIPGVHTPKDEFFMSSPSGKSIVDDPMKWASSRASEQLTEIWRTNPGLRPAGAR